MKLLLPKEKLKALNPLANDKELWGIKEYELREISLCAFNAHIKQDRNYKRQVYSLFATCLKEVPEDIRSKVLKDTFKDKEVKYTKPPKKIKKDELLADFLNNINEKQKAEFVAGTVPSSMRIDCIEACPLWERESLLAAIDKKEAEAPKKEVDGVKKEKISQKMKSNVQKIVGKIRNALKDPSALADKMLGSTGLPKLKQKKVKALKLYEASPKSSFSSTTPEKVIYGSSSIINIGNSEDFIRLVLL